MLPRVKIETLTNQISLKYYFVGTRTCFGGSPRIQLFVDPGDGTLPGNAFGYVGVLPGEGEGSVPDIGKFKTLVIFFTRAPQWALTHFVGPYLKSWPKWVTSFKTPFPTHAFLS